MGCEQWKAKLPTESRMESVEGKCEAWEGWQGCGGQWGRSWPG